MLERIYHILIPAVVTSGIMNLMSTSDLVKVTKPQLLALKAHRSKRLYDSVTMKVMTLAHTVSWPNNLGQIPYKNIIT